MSSSLPASQATLAPPTWAGPRDECPGLPGGSLTFCSPGLLAGVQAMARDMCGPTSVFREAGLFGGHSCSIRPCPQVCPGQGLAPRTCALSRTSSCALGLGSSDRKEWEPWVLLTVRRRPSWEDTELAHTDGRRLTWKPGTPLSPPRGPSLLSISLWSLAPLLLHVGPLTLALSALSVTSPCRDGHLPLSCTEAQRACSTQPSQHGLGEAPGQAQGPVWTSLKAASTCLTVNSPHMGGNGYKKGSGHGQRGHSGCLPLPAAPC